MKSAVNIGLIGQYAPWVGAIVQQMQESFWLDLGKEEAIIRLARLVEDIAGFLVGGIKMER